MQIRSMPSSTTVIKSKWHSIVHKFHHPQQPTTTTTTTTNNTSRRRRSSEDTINQQKRRKHSDAVSVGTFESNVSIKDKFRQAIPFLRRRSSSTIPTIEEHCSNDTSYDYCNELKKLQSLYSLAVDELNYAEDSQGSSYYSGDLVTAREALDDCANAFIELLRHTTDPITREGLQSSMTPKLMKLQSRFEALPEVDEENDFC